MAGDELLDQRVHALPFGARLRAGQRVVRLQRELENDQEEIRRFAAVEPYFSVEINELRDDGKRHVVYKRYTLSLNEKAKLRQWIEARTAKKIPENGEYDISQELGKPCLLTVVEKNGYPKIAGVSAVPKGLPVPDAQHAPFLMSLDEFKAGGKKKDK